MSASTSTSITFLKQKDEIFDSRGKVIEEVNCRVGATSDRRAAFILVSTMLCIIEHNEAISTLWYGKDNACLSYNLFLSDHLSPEQCGRSR